MDEGSGDHVGDSSGNGNHGTLSVGGRDDVNGKWVDGVRGTALEFDGSNDYIDCGNDPSLDITGEITIEAWVKAREDVGRFQVILAKGDGVTERSYVLNIEDVIGDDKSHTGDNSYARFFYHNGSQFGWEDTIGSTSRVRNGNWHHIVGVFTGVEIQMWVDGKLEAKREKITDNQYLILDRKINEYSREFRGTARLTGVKDVVKKLPPAIRDKVQNILEDGKVTKEEFDELEEVLWEENISEEDREELGHLAVQWLQEDSGETVEWGYDKDEVESDAIEPEVEHVPRKDFGRSFTDIVKDSVAPPPPEESPAQPPTAQQAPIQKYLHKGTRKIGEGMPEIYLPETESAAAPAPPPAPGVAMPKLEEGDTKTKFLPEGEKDLTGMVDSIIEEGQAAGGPQPAPPDEAHSVPEPVPEEPGAPSLSDGAGAADDVPELPSAPGDEEKKKSVTENDVPPPPV